MWLFFAATAVVALVFAYAYGRRSQRRTDEENRQLETSIDHLTKKVAARMTDLDRVSRGAAFDLMTRNAHRHTFTNAELMALLDSEPELGSTIQQNFATLLRDPDLRDLQFQDRIRYFLPHCRDFADEIRTLFSTAGDDTDRLAALIAHNLIAAHDDIRTQADIRRMMDEEDNYLCDCENALNFVLTSDRRDPNKVKLRELVKAKALAAVS